MNEHQLRCFIAAAAYLNFTKAAQELFMTQAAMTYQIGELEKLLGVRLFDRERGKVSLTRAGEAFYESSVGLLAAMEKARERARAAVGDGDAALAIGCYGDVMHPFLPHLLARLRRRCAAVRPTLRQGMARRLVEELHNGEIDLAFLTGYGNYVPSLSWLDTRLVLRDFHVAVVPAGHELARRETVRMEELAAEPKILLSERDLLDREDPFPLDGNVILLEDPQSVGVLVAAGFGISVSVSHVAPRWSDRVSVVPIEDTAMDVYACFRRDNAKAPLAAFLDVLGEWADEGRRASPPSGLRGD